MATLSDLARQHTGLDAAGRAHLRRLIGSWGPLSDMSFSDLLLFAPTDSVDGPGLVVLAQARPVTAQTLYVDDQLGRLFESSARPVVSKALATGEIIDEEVDLQTIGRRSRITAIPVLFGGRVIAVVTRESGQLEERAPADLELAYLDVVERLSRMIADGTFPFPFEDAVTEETPRVGDGVLVLQADTRVVFSSPNAVSALHRAGYHGRIVDRRLEDLGFDGALVSSAYRLQVPVIQELERGDDVTILSRIVPLIDGGTVTGALVLMRDVSDLRRRDRLLVSANATIKEIHHRVKNNLQTVSSLLRIQGRRMESEEAKAAIDESVRRIQSIATIHELLATKGGDDVAFNEIVEPLVAMAESSLVSSDRPIRFHLVGEGATLSASKASSLAVVVTELLQNSIEHGFPTGSAGGSILVELMTTPTEFRVRVHDDGVGVDPGFDMATSSGLGLTIISTLISGELDGELKVRPATAPQQGTVAEVRIRVDDPDEDR
ncbi:MAG: histidine kinase N-terminal domain-containing protein [Actinomycetota bacterium]